MNFILKMGLFHKFCQVKCLQTAKPDFIDNNGMNNFTLACVQRVENCCSIRSTKYSGAETLLTMEEFSLRIKYPKRT